MTRVCILLAMLVLHSGAASAQVELLPPGVGLYSLGYRQMATQTKEYNNDGQLQPLGEPFSRHFTGENLRRGYGGDDLEKLAGELKNFDGLSASSGDLLDTLYLGKLNAEVRADVDAKILGFGYGLTKNVSLFLGVPWTKATVDTELSFGGANNAQEIKARLGALAYDDLQRGLDEAALLSTADVEEEIAGHGYKNFKHWQHEGLGDVQLAAVVGGNARLTRELRSYQLWRTVLSVPTGYYDNPDVLTDVNLGRGYYLLTNRYAQKIAVYRQSWFGGEFSYGYGLPAKVKKRLPEGDEALVAADRKTTVTLQPGADLDYGLLAGYNTMGELFKFEYKLGVKRHFSDKYTGSRRGNYDELSAGSSLYQTYHEPLVKLDTVRYFRQGRVWLPMLVQLHGHLPITAKNSPDERYYQLTMASFFQ